MSTSLSEFALDPRLQNDTHAIGDLPLSRVLLMNDTRFPWLILVPRQPALRDLDDLAPADRHRLLDEISLASAALRTLCQPHKLNIAALGNVVAQLHVHVIARQLDDAAWPRPVFGVGSTTTYPQALLATRSAALRTALGLSP